MGGEEPDRFSFNPTLVRLRLIRELVDELHSYQVSIPRWFD